MKKLAAIVFVLAGLQGFSQSRTFDGLWTGTIETSEGDEFSLTLYIDDNNVYSVTEDDEGDLVKYRHEVDWSKGMDDQLNFVWMNKGGVWTETQMYSISWIEPGKLSVYHMRHVSNEDEEGDVTNWGYSSEGYLYKDI